MGIARKKLLIENSNISYLNGLPDWSNLAVIEQWRNNVSAASVADDYLSDAGNSYILTTKSISKNLESSSTRPAWNTVDDILASSAVNSYIYRAVAPCYIAQFSKIAEDDSHSDNVCVIGDSVNALKDITQYQYNSHRAILNMCIDGTWGANWMIPIVPKTDHFYFRFCQLSTYGVEMCIIPILGSGLTGKDCYRNTNVRGTNNLVAAGRKHTCRDHLSNLIRTL